MHQFLDEFSKELSIIPKLGNRVLEKFKLQQSPKRLGTPEQNETKLLEIILAELLEFPDVTPEVILELLEKLLVEFLEEMQMKFCRNFWCNS